MLALMALKHKDLNLLHTSFAPIAEKWIAAVKASGLRVFIIETLRTPERQAEVFAAGASQIKTGGFHERGLALDFGLLDYKGVYQTNNLSGDYTIAGELAEGLGCVWGGRWKKLRDYGHIEYHLPEGPLVA